MNVLPVLDVFHGKITDLIAPDDELCFLVGAGISMDPPSSLPSAREIVKTLVQACVPADDVERILSLHTLRYELLVEGIEKIIDEDLKFLDYLDMIKEPNAIHQFLAFSIDHGHHVFTTNFDALIEIALIDTLPPERRHGVAVVITRDDYLRCVHPNEGMKSGTRLLFKLHGAKRNHVTGQNTKDSLITTTSALGKNKEGGTSFAIEAFKKPAINCAVQGRILVVMGYSGHDDFDIGPALLELQGVKRVIWIDHVPAMASKIDMYRVRDGIEPRACEGIDHVDQVLSQLKTRVTPEVYKIKAHTGWFTSEIAWKSLFPGISGPMVVMNQSIVPDFKDFTAKMYPAVPILKKHVLACWIYWKLGEYEAYKRTSMQGLDASRETGDIEMTGEFLENLGGYHFIKGEFPRALAYFEQAIEEIKNIEHFKRAAVFFNNLGEARRASGAFDQALACYHQANDHAVDTGDMQSRATALNNIAWIHHLKGDVTAAETFFKQALEIDGLTGDLGTKAMHASNIGAIQYNQGQYQKAMSSFQEALKIANQLGEVSDKVTFLNNLGMVYKATGDYKPALEHYLQALDIVDASGLIDSKATVLNNIGGIYHDAGLLDQALAYYVDALGIATRVNNQSRMCLYLNNIGSVHRDLGQVDHAFDVYHDAYDIAEAIKDKYMMAVCLNNIGSIHKDRGETAKAIPALSAALEIAIEIKNPSIQDTINKNLNEARNRELAS